ncbi:MAG: MBL fold metallo-hydrolase [Candidatus Flexifilum sp.]|jgi:L-ascorbate metabolism protein UlaG (beta-lactamase superfamily)
MLDQIEWLGHDSFALQTSPNIYINPWRIASGERGQRCADIILISSSQHHHFSPADIDKLSAEHTIIIAPEAVARERRGIYVLRPWQTMTVGRVGIKAIPTYSGDPDHSQTDELGFVISYNYFDLYYAGSTVFFPELRALRPDIAILPIDGRPLTAADAAELAVAIRPRAVIPSRWGLASGAAGRMDARLFATAVAERAPDIQVHLLTP